jgi:hypothetical protein
MIDLDLPLPPPSPVELVLDKRRTRRAEGAGRDGEAPPEPRLAGRVALGGPIAAKVSAALVNEDPALAAFVEAEAATSRFVLLHLAVTFLTAEGDPPLDTASVEFRMDGGSGAAPIAWSMAPSVVTHPSEVSRKVTIGPQLKLLGAEVGGLGVERSRTHQSSEVFLEALRELRSDPAWAFSRTASAALRGSHRLVMIAHASLGTSARAEVSLRATVRRRRRIFAYRAALPDPITLSFDF